MEMSTTQNSLKKNSPESRPAPPLKTRQLGYCHVMSDVSVDISVIARLVQSVLLSKQSEPIHLATHTGRIISVKRK